MARKQKLINLHNGAKKAPKASELFLGEIAVQHNIDEAALYTKVSDDKVAKFIDEDATEALISTAVAGLNSALTADIEAVEDKADDLEGRVETLEALSAETRISALEDDSHVHGNKAILDGITAEKVAAWDASGSDAKDYIDGVLSAYTKTEEMNEAIADAKNEAISAATANTVEALKVYATSADTVAAIEAVDAKFADYATSADTFNAIEAVKTVATAALEDYATSADTVAAINAVDGKFANYATSAQTVAAIEAVDGKFANYATSADTFNAIEAAKTASTEALKAYATSADTVAAIEAVDGKFASYATSADTVAAIKVVDDKVVALESISADTRLKALEEDSADADALADEIARATSAETALEARLDVLEGEGEGSVKKAVNDAIDDFATKVSDDNVVNSFKELVDWAAEHGGEAAEFAAAIEKLEGGDTVEGSVAKAEKDAKEYADGLNTAMDARVDALEAVSAETRISAVEAKFANYATSADTVAAIEAAKTASTEALKDYATSAQTVAAIEAVDGKFANYATSANTVAAIEAVDGKFANYATSADTFNAIEAAKTAATAALEDYATSADTVAAIEAVDGKFANYATSAETVAAIEGVDGKFANYATSADTVAAIEAAFEGAVADVEMAEDETSQSVSAEVVDGVATFDFSAFVIDCGEYEGEVEA